MGVPRWSAGVILLLWGLTICRGRQPVSVFAEEATGEAASAQTSEPSRVGPPGVPAPPERRPRRSIAYTNDRYGFKFYLPKSWKGYLVVSSKWQSVVQEELDASGNPRPEQGPIFTLRNPRWTEQRPWQDIPIMVFTIEQWGFVHHDRMILSAAPVGPSEIGRNCRYVFALPARYNYADVDGVEEVNALMQTQPLHAY
jgi:hypothetical protein